MKRYEYTTVILTNNSKDIYERKYEPARDDLLSKMGALGWQLCAKSGDEKSINHEFFFKREF